MNCNALRKKIIVQRSQLGTSELHRIGTSIADWVLSAFWYHEAQSVHSFFGVESKGEIPTLKILEDVLAKGKYLAMPRITGMNGEMEHIRVGSLDSLRKGPWGIPQPFEGESVESSSLDLVIVPGLAADRKGNRIGYGKGYYDRFLISATNAKKVMLLPRTFLMDQIPVKDHDVPMDMLVTETGIIRCR